MWCRASSSGSATTRWDIGEQVAFLVTGQFREFTDASHPEIEHPELLQHGTAAS
jgi:hypothetical protein